MHVLCNKLENKHDYLYKRYTLKYISSETDAKHEPVRLETCYFLMHMQYISNVIWPTEQLVLHLFNLETHEHEWLAHCKRTFLKLWPF